jgi:hypothetical protein
MGDELARVKQLRDCFEGARKRLEALPESGLSNDGQPYVREVAEALKSFAAWFGELTLDDMGLCGSAYRVHDTLNGVDAIVDWVGLHRSQQFAQDIGEHASELAKKSQALDDAVSAAFRVKRTASEESWSRNRHVPQKKRDAIDDGIQEVASLAGHLGVRLQRIALMAGSPPTKASSATKQTGCKQTKRRGRKRGGGRPEKYPEEFIREVFAARERDEKHAAKAKRRLPPWVPWLWDFCQSKVNIAEMFPPAFKGEPWQARAERFKKAAKKRLKALETNRH